MWPHLLVILQLYGYLEGSEGQLLDTGSPVTTTASSTYVEDDGVEHSPKLAVKGDLKRTLPNCFLSNQTSHPWFSLNLKSVTSIYNIRLRLPRRSTMKNLDGVSEIKELRWLVSISNSSTWDSNNGKHCKDFSPYAKGNDDANLQCGNDLKGQFIYISINSNEPTYLGICDIVVNDQQPESSSPLNWSQDNAIAVSSGFDAAHPPSYAIDGISTSEESSCSTIMSTENNKAWLLVDMQTVRYISKVTVLFLNTSTDDFTINVGRSLLTNGADGNIRCMKSSEQGSLVTVASNDNYTFALLSATCSEPILGQYIYIETQSKLMRICEVEAFSNYLLNIYNSVNVTASDQANLYTSIWKPIDGVKGTSLNSAWISKSSSNSWWRMEFPYRYAVFRIVLYLPKLGNASISKMLGSALYVGDSSVGNGSQNSICGFLSRIQEGGQFAIDCSSPSVGKYLFLSAANKSGAKLFLSEISVVGCKVPTASSTDLVVSSDRMLQFDRPTCHGCMTKRVHWTNDGNSTMDNRSVSTVIVNALSDDQSTKCVLRYVGGYGDDLTVDYFRWSGRLEISQQNLTIRDIGETYEVNCTVTGNPQFTVQWIKLADMYDLHLSDSHMKTFNNSTTDILKVESPDDGGKYRCVGKSLTGKKLATDIFVYAAPKVRLSIVPNLEFIGMTLAINCTILQGYPPPSLKLTSNSRSLFSKANTSHSMAYNLTVPYGWLGEEFHCIAENAIGKDNESISFKDIDVPPLPQLLVTPPSNTTLGRNGVDIFKCTARGYPVALQWMKIDGLSHEKRQLNTTSTNSFTSFLHVRGSDGGGKYRCMAINTTVNMSLHQDITVYERPQVTLSIVPDRPFIGKHVTINCTIRQGYPLTNVTLIVSDSRNFPTMVDSSSARDDPVYVPTIYSSTTNEGDQSSSASLGSVTANPTTASETSSSEYGTVPTRSNSDSITTDALNKRKTEKSPYANASAELDEKNTTFASEMSDVMNSNNNTVEPQHTNLSTDSTEDGSEITNSQENNSSSSSTDSRNTIATVAPTASDNRTSGKREDEKGDLTSSPATDYPHRNITTVEKNSSVIYKLIAQSDILSLHITCKANNIAGTAQETRRFNATSFQNWTASLNVWPHNITILELSTSNSSQFNCTATGFPKLTVRWVKVNDFDETTYLSNNTKSSNDSQTSILSVTDPKQSGRYKCIGTPKSAAHKGLDEAVIVSIYGPPEIHLSTTPSIAAFGEKMNISCTATQGYPKPNITLSPPCKDCKLVTANNSKYYSTIVTAEHVGKMIKCEASNTIGNTSTKILYANIRPHVDLSASKSRVNIGDTVTLNCSTFGYPSPMASLFVPNRNQAVRNFTSQIKFEFNVTVGKPGEEGGVYNCSSNSSVGETYKTVTIEVMPSAHLSLNNTEQNVGETLEISCLGYGYPPPTMLIIGPNNEKSDNGSINEVKLNVSIGDFAEGGGNYSCLATNTAGNATDHIEINVKPTAHLSVSSSETEIGETVVISCTGFGYPIPQLSLFLPNGSFHNSTAGAKVEINVTIGKLAKEGGLYKCSSINSLGNSQNSTTIRVKPTADLVVSSKIAQRGETVNVSCSAVGYPNANVTLSAPNGSVYPLTSKSKIHINIIIGQSAEGGGAYNCSSENSAGMNHSTKTISVKPKVELTPKNAILRIGKTTDIFCEASGYPLPEVSLSSPNGTLLHSHKLNVSLLSTRFKWEITIRELAQEGGLYNCSATSSIGREDNTTILHVKPAVDLMVNSTEVEFGDTFKVTCRGHGYPAPKISITLPNGTVRNVTAPNESTFSINIREKEGGGIYSCSATNIAGSEAENVTVNVKPNVSINASRNYTETGQKVNIMCHGIGYPSPNMSLLTPNGSTYNFNSSITLSVKIGNFGEGGGNYTCLATNGNVSTTKTVVVPVKIEVNCKPSTQTVPRGNSGKVNCTAYGYPHPSLIRISLPNGTNTIYHPDPTAKPIMHMFTVHVDQSSEGGGKYIVFANNSKEERKDVAEILVPLVVEPPLFEDNSSKVNYGSNVTITCKVSGFPLWKDIVLLHGGRPDPIHPNKTVFITTPTYKKTNFFINSVDVSHAGEYSCQLESKVSPNVSLEVGPHFIHSPKALNITEGSSTNLSCTATGSPLLTVRMVKKAKNTIEINVTSDLYENTITATAFWDSINRSDIGYYRCEAENGIGEAVLSDLVNVNVHYAPNAVVDAQYVLLNSSKDSFHNETLILNCSITGNPSPSVVWSKKPLDDVAVSTSSINVSYTRTFIDEFAITNDSGVYTCTAWNYLGSSSNTVRVTVQERPHSVKRIATSSVTARTVTVHWKTPFDGYNTIDSYVIHLRNRTDKVESIVKVTQPYNYSTEFSFTAENLRPFTFYDIDVQAFNDLGGSNRTLTVPVKTKATAAGPATNVSVTAVTSTKIIVTWGPPNEPNGNILQYSVYHEVFENDNTRRRRAGKNETPITVTGNVNQTFIKDLKIYTQYSVSIEVVSEGDNETFTGARSKAVIIRTLEDKSSNPEILSVDLVQGKPTELTVTWKRPVTPNGNITMYSVLYQEVGQSSNTTKNVSATGNETESASLTGLLEYTNYSVQVRAISSSGIGGNLSLALVGRTDEGKPSKPENFTVLDITDSSVRLKWEQPILPRGIITKYQIEYVGIRHYTESGVKKVESQTKTETVLTGWQKTLTKLMPSTKFNFTIFACTTKGPGDGASKSATTDVARPKQPVLPKRTPELVNNGTGLRVTLVQPSNQYGNIIYIDLLVAKMGENDTTIFAKETQKEYNASFPENTIYITARFNYSELPTQFIIGDGEKYGTYHNGPLEKGSMYFYALRSYTRDQQGKILFSTSKIGLGDLSIESKDSDSSSNTGLVAAVAIIVIIIALVLILLFILYRRRREREEKLGRGSARHLLRPEETPMTNIEDAEIQKSAILGQTALLEVSDTGLKSTMVEWKLNGKQLPGEDERIQVLQNGSLQIKDVKVLDYGVYECCEINSGNSGKLRLLVQMPNHGPKPVRLSETEQYVDEMHANDNWGFKSQYEMLPKGERHQYTAARMDHNRCKNRYGNIVPYDHSRVVLEGGPDYDYINASYMNGCDGPNVYIAAQGPTDNTIDDFWRMVWEKNVVSIVMVTNLVENGKVKCSKYWPEDENQYGDISVRLCRVLSVAEFFIRSFLVTKSESEEERNIKQFHFIAWPDHGVPSYPTSLLNLLKLVRNHQESSESTGPILVHCSAGVGRTGTYIAIDNSLRQLKLDASLDIFNCISSMRENRPSMVQTENQYIFCHDAVLEYVLCGETSVVAHSLRARIKTLSSVNQEEGVSGYKKELKLLAKVSPSESSFTTTEASMPENLNKNRYRGNLPPDGCCVHLSPIVDKPAHFKYINACLVDAYRRRDYYITTQGPLENTVSDFWRMVWEKQCGAIVMLTSVEENGRQMSATYWPTSATLEAGFLTIKLDDETTHEEYTIRTFSIVSQEEETRTVLQFHMTTWPDNRCPENATTILKIMGKVERTQQKSGDNPVIVMCNNGIDRSGTFCAIGIAIDRLKSEQVVDVFQAVKYLRTQNPKFLRKQQHYKFCYTACLEYLDSFDTYANFKEL